MTHSTASPFDILLVEDNDFDARRVARALSQIGSPHRLRRAMDGQEALGLLRESAARPNKLQFARSLSTSEKDDAEPGGVTPMTKAADSAAADDDALKFPCVVFLDLNMPVMGGIAFLAALRADEALANTPVVVMTTSEFYKDVAQAHAFNICGYIVKPVDSSEMIELTRRVIGFLDCCVLPP